MKTGRVKGVVVWSGLSLLVASCDVGPVTPPEDEETGADTDTDTDADTDRDLQNLWQCLICEG